MTTKTSIRNIDPDVLWGAKVYAAETRLTMGQVVTEALERLIDEDQEDGDDQHDQVSTDPEIC